MGCVPLLPQEFHGPQEEPGAHFPAHYIGPLIDQYGQIAVRLDPLAIHMSDDRLRGRSYYQGFLQLLSTAVGNNCQFRREPFHVFGFLLDKAQRNQEREIRVLVTRLLESAVEALLDILP